jgi:antitoxin (DNA-binding transcriptional repressor) of toxin-antitoxin stability system
MSAKKNIIGLKELRENTATYIREVSRGRSFIIMQRSKPIFSISPVDVWSDEGSWETAVDFSTMKKLPKLEEVLKSLKKLNGSGQYIFKKASP